MPYAIHPTDGRTVITPDGGVIECRHEAAAKRVCAELNERDCLLVDLWRRNVQLRDALRSRSQYDNP